MAFENFDPYEVSAVIVPGSFVAVPLVSEWPQLARLVGGNLDLAGLGLFAIFAFSLGHILQFLGNLIEDLMWWATGGLPSDRVLRAGSTIISPQQLTQLEARIKKNYESFSFTGLKVSAWRPHTREIYAELRAAERNEPVDRHNRTFGMLRGLSAAFLVLAVWSLCAGQPEYSLAALLLSCLAAVRAYRFGLNYARELFVQYLALREAPESIKEDGSNGAKPAGTSS